MPLYHPPHAALGQRDSEMEVRNPHFFGRGASCRRSLETSESMRDRRHPVVTARRSVACLVTLIMHFADAAGASGSTRPHTIRYPLVQPGPGQSNIQIVLEESTGVFIPRSEGIRMYRVDSQNVHRKLQSTLTLTAFGQDLNEQGSLDPLPAWPNSDAARDEFNTLFDRVETEDFESFDLGTQLPITTNAFSSVGPATFSGATGAAAFISETGGNQSRLFATSPTKFLFVSADQEFKITFDTPVSMRELNLTRHKRDPVYSQSRDPFFLFVLTKVPGFSFYGTDVGDLQGTVIIETSLNGGNVKQYEVPVATPPGGVSYERHCSLLRTCAQLGQGKQFFCCEHSLTFWVGHLVLLGAAVFYVGTQLTDSLQVVKGAR
jgi:hypothetical protein